MVNFYVPNYTKKEFEELDNKVLLLSKEKYSQLNIKFKEKCCSIYHKNKRKYFKIDIIKFIYFCIDIGYKCDTIKI